MTDWSEDYSPSRNRRLVERDKCRRLVWSGRKGPDRGMLVRASIADLIPEGTIWRKRPVRVPSLPDSRLQEDLRKSGRWSGDNQNGSGGLMETGIRKTLSKLQRFLCVQRTAIWAGRMIVSTSRPGDPPGPERKLDPLQVDWEKEMNSWKRARLYLRSRLACPPDLTLPAVTDERMKQYAEFERQTEEVVQSSLPDFHRFVGHELSQSAANLLYISMLFRTACSSPICRNVGPSCHRTALGADTSDLNHKHVRTLTI